MSAREPIAEEEAATRALEAWGIAADQCSIEALDGGHIHRSLRVRGRADSTGADSPLLPGVLQRLNPAVFTDTEAVMANLSLVLTQLVQRSRSRGEDVARRVPTLLPTADGARWYSDPEGGAWRLFREIQHTETLTAPDSPARAHSAALAFGRFQSDLEGLAAKALVEVLPDFHHTPRRYLTLDRAHAEDRVGRARDAAAEIAFAERHRGFASTLLDLSARGGMPLRAVHNDAKIANVLFDEADGEALCAIDYDTVMPGVALYDFGDLVRSMATRASEDARDLSTVVVDRELLDAVVDGYLEGTRELLSPSERSHLLEGALVIVLEQGVRFLTDYLAGDRYYAVERPEHNLDRCRVQFTLFEGLRNCPEAFERG